MSTFDITGSTLTSQFVYKNDELIINGNFVKNAVSDELQSVYGSVYEKDAQGGMGAPLGSFNGTSRGSGIRYSFSDIALQDISRVEAAVQDIQNKIIPTDE